MNGSTISKEDYDHLSSEIVPEKVSKLSHLLLLVIKSMHKFLVTMTQDNRHLEYNKQ